MGSTGLSCVGPTGRGAGATSALAKCRCHASGSDWQPTTSPGRTVVGVLPAGADPSSARCSDRTGRGRWFFERAIERRARRPADRARLPTASVRHSERRRSGTLSDDRSRSTGLYPPPGLALRYPIPIELTQDELELAARGAFVTRVIYIEDPQQALPISRKASDEQPWVEAPPGEDPLVTADRQGPAGGDSANRRPGAERGAIRRTAASARRNSSCSIRRPRACADATTVATDDIAVKPDMSDSAQHDAIAAAGGAFARLVALRARWRWRRSFCARAAAPVIANASGARQVADATAGRGTGDADAAGRYRRR